MKLRNLLIFLFLLVSLNGSIISGVLFYFSTSTIAINNNSQSLLAIAQSRAEHIKTYFNDEIEKLKLITGRIQLKIDIKNYLESPGPELKEIIRIKLNDAKTAVVEYRHICLIGLDGKVATCDDSSIDGQDLSQEDFFIKGKIKEGVYFFNHAGESREDIATSGPVSSDGKLMGVIVNFESFDALGKIIKNRIGLGETGEVLVAYQDAKNGQIIYPFPRLSTTTTTTTTGQPMKQALFGNESIFINTLDYREVSVTAASQYIDIADMGLVAKMDTAEITGKYKTALIVDSIAFGLISLLVSFIIGFFLAYFISRSLTQLTKGAEMIGQGNLDYKIDIKTKDEFGILAGTFNKMAASLREFNRGLEQKVRDKTKELSLSLKQIEKKNVLLEDNKKAMLNILEDVEREKDTANAEKEKTNTILYSIGDGVFVVDADYKIMVFNSVAAKISGYSIKEALGKRYDQVLKFAFEENGKAGTVNDVFIKKAMTTGLVAEMANHTVLLAKDGQKIPVADSAAPLKDKAGKVIGCVVVFRDVTKEREIDRIKTEFVSVASHQLRTPLTGIKWFSELLLAGKAGELTKKQKDFLNQVSGSNERMISLVDDLLDVSHIETGRKFNIEKKMVDLPKIIGEVLTDNIALATKKKIKVTKCAGAPKEMKILADGEKIAQVFHNLISNAIKYSPVGGKVEIGCDHEKAGEITFYIKDNGFGIPKAQQHRVFEKFFRADNIMTKETDGTGLGLYITKAIVEAHGGRVWFESAENKGTTFYFSLPNQVESQPEPKIKE